MNRMKTGTWKKACAGIALAAGLLLGACRNEPQPPAPATESHVALWEVTGPGGARGWLFGTVHALPEGTRWTRPAIAQALGAADRLVFEIGEPLDAKIAGEALGRLAFTQGLPPPSERIDPAYRGKLAAVYKDLSLTDAQFRDEESWAVALQISAIAGQKHGMDPDNGVEPELRRMAKGKLVTGLETIDSQFGIFDRLGDREQKVLLEQVAEEASSGKADEQDILALWLRGDDLGIARESETGFLADPGLHEALLAARNRNWTGQIDAMLKAGAHPFVAVGAAHVSGSDGLPRMLAERGWTVRRVQ